MTDVKDYRDHLRMVEILNRRFQYEDIIKEGNITVPKHLRKLNKNNISESLKYFSHSYHPLAEDLVQLIQYYATLEALEDA